MAVSILQASGARTTNTIGGIETKLKREQRGTVNVNPILIAVLIGIAAVVGAAWYYQWGPFSKGEVYVDLGYVLADGTEVPFNAGQLYAFYQDPITLALYTDSSKTTAVAGVYGVLVAKPVTDIENAVVSTTWTRYVEAHVVTWSHQSFDATGTLDMQPNVQITIATSKCLITPSTFSFYNTATYSFRFTYTVSGSVRIPTAGGGYTYVTATATAVGTIDVYYTSGTLSMVVSVTPGYLNIVR